MQTTCQSNSLLDIMQLVFVSWLFYNQVIDFTHMTPEKLSHRIITGKKENAGHAL